MVAASCFSSLSTLLLACRTGVIFCVFQANRGESEASAKRELRAWGGSRGFFSDPPLARNSRSPRARLAFASVRLKYAKNHACYAGYFAVHFRPKMALTFEVLSDCTCYLGIALPTHFLFFTSLGGLNLHSAFCFA